LNPLVCPKNEKNCFSQITFFKKVMGTKIHYKKFLGFYSAHFGIQICPFKKEKILNLVLGQIF